MYSTSESKPKYDYNIKFSFIVKNCPVTHIICRARWNMSINK